MNVRAVNKKLSGTLAHTTVMTTLDRLFKKKLLHRHKEGTAYVYRPAMSREDFHRALLEETVGQLLEASGTPVLAAFVDTAAEIDEQNLAKLEALIAARRKGRQK